MMQGPSIQLGSGLPGSLPSYLLYPIIYYCIFLIWLLNCCCLLTPNDEFQVQATAALSTIILLFYGRGCGREYHSMAFEL